MDGVSLLFSIQTNSSLVSSADSIIYPDSSLFEALAFACTAPDIIMQFSNYNFAIIVICISIL